MKTRLKELRDSVLAEEQTVLLKYVRKKNGTRTGVMVGFLDPVENKTRVGWSRCNSKNDQFNRDVGLEIAVGRACKTADVIESDNEEWRDVMLACDFPHSMAEEMGTFVGKVVSHFKK